MNFPNRIELNVDVINNNAFIRVSNLVKWLKHEIRIAHNNMMDAKQSPEYEFSKEEKYLSEGEKNAFNHLLTELGEPYYNGNS